MTPAELYAFNFQNSEPKFYTRMPNIIDHLTYEVIDKDGVKSIKRLSIYAKELYRVIRMIASDHGKDWHTTEQLAEIIGCSVGSVVNAKKELLMPMIQLENNPLIIEERKSTTKEVNGHKFATVLCKRTITDIWKWNNAFMATVKYQNKFGKVTDSCGESVDGTDSCGESVSQGTDSCGEANNNNNKNPLSKEQQPTATADSVCLLNKSVDVVSVAAPETDKAKKEGDAFNYLLKVGFDVFGATSIIKSYTIDQISQASVYSVKQRDARAKKNEPILNFPGYFRKVLEQKWYMQKPAQ